MKEMCESAFHFHDACVVCWCVPYTKWTTAIHPLTLQRIPQREVPTEVYTVRFLTLFFRICRSDKSQYEVSP